MFVDADVELAHHAIHRVVSTFAERHQLDAVMGCYDDEPSEPGVVSRFRNLLHHHTHNSHPGRAVTFWAGCGAVRTHTFRGVEGFDTEFVCPSVEDIDLGMRIASAGGHLALDPLLRCKHLKAWTLWSMIRTDIKDRATPWSRLLIAAGQFPSTLNIDWSNRVSGAAAVALAVCLVAAVASPLALAPATVAACVLARLNRGFYRLCHRKYGFGFATACVGLHALFLFYSSVTFGVVVMSLLPGRLVQRALSRHVPSSSERASARDKAGPSAETTR